MEAFCSMASGVAVLERVENDLLDRDLAENDLQEAIMDTKIIESTFILLFRLYERARSRSVVARASVPMVAFW